MHVSVSNLLVICVLNWAVALVQWLYEQTQVQEDVGSNPSTKHWMVFLLQ